MKDLLSPTKINELLEALGTQLALAGKRCAIVIVGGAALGLAGVVQRATEDVDVIALGDDPRGTRQPRPLRPADPLPRDLEAAIAVVTRDFALTPGWINPMVSQQWRTGLPEGLDRRVHWRTFGGLDVGVADRRDLIFLKLFAAADHGPASRHYSDLLALMPSAAELEASAAWVRSQDASPEFGHIVDQLLSHVRADTGDDR